jgi:hypothetical protein
MRARFWLGLGLAGLGLFDACLPEVTIDDTLGPDPDTKTGSEQGGTGGAAGSGPGAGKGGTAGAGGASTAGSTSVTEGVGGTEGGTQLPDPATAMGGAAGAGTPSAGAGGAAATAGAAGTSAAAGAGGLDGPGVATQCPLPTDKESACLAYCQIYMSTCSETTANTYKDAVGEDCLGVCYASDWPVGNSYTEKSSITCRCAHAYLAQTTQQLTPHCFHSAEVPSMGPAGCQPDP